jgi:hypothetical protein
VTYFVLLLEIILQTGSRVRKRKRKEDILSPRTPLLPNIPLPIRSPNPCFLPQFSDLWTCNALIIAIIPLPYILCDLNRRLGPNLFFGMGALVFPGELLSAAKVEELEGALGTAAGGDVSLD